VTPDAIVFLQGIAAMGAWVSGLFFLRFWRESREPLFGFFAAAFWLLALSWTALAMFSPTEDFRPYVYGLRLIAFALIIAGIVVKNREAGS
jgi:hypothetical protein